MGNRGELVVQESGTGSKRLPENTAENSGEATGTQQTTRHTKCKLQGIRLPKPQRGKFRVKAQKKEKKKKAAQVA